MPTFNHTIITGKSYEPFISHRIRQGDSVQATDLDGTVATIEIVCIDKKRRTIEWRLMKRTSVPRPVQFVLFQAIIDKKYLEKLADILPFSNFSSLHLLPLERSQPTNISIARLQSLIDQSCLIAEKAWSINIHVYNTRSEAYEAILTYRPVVLEKHSDDSLDSTTNVSSVLVGPEGGFSQSELDRFRDAGLDTVSLARYVLPSWLAGSVYSFTKMK